MHRGWPNKFCLGGRKGEKLETSDLFLLQHRKRGKFFQENSDMLNW